MRSLFDFISSYIGWKIDQDHSSHCTMVGSDGGRIWVQVANSKVVTSGIYPKPKHTHDYFGPIKRVEVSSSIGTPHLKIAKRILNVFLPQYREEMFHMAQKIARADQHRKEMEDLQKRVAAMIGCEVYHDQKLYLQNIYGTLDFSPGSSTVRIVMDLPIDNLEEVLWAAGAFLRP